MAALFADKIMVDGLCLVLARSSEGQNWSHSKNVARRVCEVQANILFWAPWIWGVLWTWWWFPQREKTYSVPLCRGRTTGSCFWTTVGNQFLAVMCNHFNVLVVFYTFLEINLKCSSIVILAPMNLFPQLKSDLPPQFAYLLIIFFFIKCQILKLYLAGYVPINIHEL